jgi:hypothetical protein
MKYLEVLTALVNPVPITGRFLAHNRKNRIERAFLAADLHTGAKGLVEPTVSQSALLTDVNRTYAWWAVKRQAERTQIEAGLVPLIPASSVAHAANGNNGLPALAIEIPDFELIEFVCSVGVDRVLDAAVVAEAAE